MADVIVNTSPLQYLHQAGQLELFPKLFGHIIVPDAVAEELAAGRRLGVSLPDLSALAWVGILLRAKQAGHLLLVRPVLAPLSDLGFRLTVETTENALDLAGE